MIPELLVLVSEPRGIVIKGHGPGELSGQGISVEVRLTNNSHDPVDLGGVVVNAFYGKLPATMSASSTDYLRGRLAPGRNATGHYAFLPPADASGALRIEVEHSQVPNIVVVNP